jgi:hypothetical protein
MKKCWCFLGAVAFSISVVAQEVVPFNGLLLDAVGKPIRRARIYTQSPDKYATSDKQGRFGLTNVGLNDTLKVRHEKHTYYIPVSGRRSMQIRIMEDMQVETFESAQLLDFGFNYVKQREYAGYNSKITGEELMATGCTDILSALSGMIPGLNISENTEGEGYKVDIRGNGNPHGDATPLYVVDDLVVPSIDHIHLNQVAYVIVMKEATLYGFRGGNGAIVVRLKSAQTAQK